MMIGKQFEKERDKLEKEMSTLDKSWKHFLKSRKRKIRAAKVHPERTVGTLYATVSPGDPMGADRAGI